MTRIRRLLEGESSRARAQKVADLASTHPDDLSELMELFFSDDLRVCQRASWPVGMLGAKHPHLIRAYIPLMIQNLDRSVHNAIVRNTFRTWKEMDFDEEWEGEIYEKSFQYLSSPQSPIAVQVFSMMVCTNIAVRYPALAEELIPVIEEIYPHGSSGFRSRAKKELVRLRGIAGA